MKTLQLHTLATAFALFTLQAQPVNAGVVWLVSDNGTDLTMVTSGTLSNGGRTALPPRSTSPGGMIYVNSTEWWITGAGNIYFAPDSGALSGANPWLPGFMEPTSVSGETFGYMGTHLMWDGIRGASPDSITPDSTMVYQGQTVSTAFGSNLDAGPVVLWTHGTTGDTISVALDQVPEPAAVSLLGLGVFGGLLRRRK